MTIRSDMKKAANMIVRCFFRFSKMVITSFSGFRRTAPIDYDESITLIS